MCTYLGLGCLPRLLHLLEHLLLLLLAQLLHLYVVSLVHLLLVEGCGCVVSCTDKNLLAQELVLILHLLLLVWRHSH